jgi:hypothetical protein
MSTCSFVNVRPTIGWCRDSLAAELVNRGSATAARLDGIPILADPSDESLVAVRGNKPLHMEQESSLIPSQRIFHVPRKASKDGSLC